jgi:YihY family inner membrane protein
VTTARAVPSTREDDELEGDDAFETLRDAGRRRLLIDAVARFRAADGFSHSRALAFQLTLTLLPALIATVGLAAALDQESFRRAVQALIAAVTPSAAADILTDALRQGNASARQESGETAVAAGFIAAVLAGTGAMAQVERGANRIYGVESDRPFLVKYAVALGLTLTAGVLGLLSVVVLIGGAAVRDAVGFGQEVNAVWRFVRWPLGLVLVVGSVALLLEIAPRRRQPEASWLAVGAAVSATLWIAFMGLLVIYFEATGSFGATYGPLAGTIGVLLWTFLTSVALFLGVAFAAQLEAVRAGVPGPRVERDENVDGAGASR